MPKLIAAVSFPCTLDKPTNPFGMLCSIFAGRLVRDRFNVLNQHSELNWIDTVDKIAEPVATPIGEIMDRRAQELISLGSITAQWSGGVDSTSLLLALIKNGIKKEDLLVFYDDNSVEEYPKLYEHLKNQGWNFQKVKRWRTDLERTQTDIITNGWCADQLFGSVFFYSNPQDYFKPIGEFLSGMKFFGVTPSKEELKFTEETVKKYAKDVFDLELTTAAELGWFVNYTMKWTWVSNFNRLFLANSANQYKTKVFFDTPEFEGWTLARYKNINSANIYGKNALYYKKELKEYCNSIFPDEDYLFNKSKKPSWNSARNSSMYEKRRYVTWSDEGIEILNMPDSFPVRYPQIYDSKFFSKYYK